MCVSAVPWLSPAGLSGLAGDFFGFTGVGFYSAKLILADWAAIKDKNE